MENLTITQETVTVGKYFACYITGTNSYLITNMETKKDAIMHIRNPKNKNIVFIADQLNFMAGNNKLTCTRVTALDCLN